MNYEKIYNNLIQKRRINKIDRSKTNTDVEYHHVIPVSCGGTNDPRKAVYNNENYNLVGLTLREHFFAHLLLQQIYKEKYGIESLEYKCMIKAIQLMIDYKKYNIRTSKFYQKLRSAAFKAGSTITTAGRMWITNGKKDIFLKPDEPIPTGFHKGRTLNFTEEQKLAYSNKISKATKGRKSWNAGKHGAYSDEYRKKISENHADVSGENNGRFGSRYMINLSANDKLIVKKEQIPNYLNNGYIFVRDLKNKH